MKASMASSEIRRLTGSENCKCFLLHSHLTHSLGVNPFEFVDCLLIVKTRVLGLSVGEDFVILACVVLTQCRCVTHGQTDGRIDEQLDRS